MADLTVEVEVPLELPEQDEDNPPEQPTEDDRPGPARRILSGIGQVLGAAWDLVKPDDRQPPGDDADG